MVCQEVVLNYCVMTSSCFERHKCNARNDASHCFDMCLASEYTYMICACM